MTVKQRILALKLLEKQKRRREYTQRIGIQVRMVRNDPQEKDRKVV